MVERVAQVWCATLNLMWWVAAVGVEAGTTNMPNTMEPLPDSPLLDRPLPDLKPLADAAPLPDVEEAEAEAEAVALDRELDVWQRVGCYRDRCLCRMWDGRWPVLLRRI